jgi:hypothetical protein
VQYHKHQHEHVQKNVYAFLCPVHSGYASIIIYLLVVSAFSSSGTWEVLLSALSTVPFSRFGVHLQADVQN